MDNLESNYTAIIAKIDRTVAIPKADNIHIAMVLGESVVVSKEWKEGMLGVFFPSDSQLSEKYCYHNNLNRDSSKNTNTEKKGFFDTNRKVRCQPFLKVRSEAFFTHLDSLSWAGDVSKLKLGSKFEDFNGEHICKKFISEVTLRKMNNKVKSNKNKTRITETPMFNQHVSTSQYKHNTHNIEKGNLLSFHAKVHGTSARYSYSKIISKPFTFKEKVLDYFGMFNNTSWDYLVGTRRVTLYQDQYNKEGFHGSEQYRFDVLDQLKPYLEKGMTVYGEIAGYANGKPIMGVHSTDTLKDKSFKKKYSKEMIYKYGCLEDQQRFHIYRITYTNESGKELDFSDKQVHKWCSDRGFLSPLEVNKQLLFEGDIESLNDLVDSLTERPEVMCEDFIDPSHVSEGIIIRVDKGYNTPLFLKSKSYAFKVMEGIFKETNIDEEDAS